MPLKKEEIKNVVKTLTKSLTENKYDFAICIGLTLGDIESDESAVVKNSVYASSMDGKSVYVAREILTNFLEQNFRLDDSQSEIQVEKKVDD